MAAGERDKAARFYQALLERAPRSSFADFAYVGLGELSLESGDPMTALGHFEAAVDRAGARYKLREATLGRARCLFVLERWDEARELFEQIAANRAWRGEATAQSVFFLGEISARQKSHDDALAQAQAHYQRVYLGYRKFPAWVARAYLRSAEVFEAMGKPGEALATYREFLRDGRLAALPEARRAREGAARLEGIL